MKSKTLRRFLGGAVLALCLCILLPLTLAAMVMSVRETMGGPFEELLTFHGDNLMANLVLTAAALAALLGLRFLLERYAHVHLTAAMMAVWLAAALVWIWGTHLVSNIDYARVVQAARSFARDDYSPMRDGYINGFPFQLGICFLLEGVQRLLPWADIDLLMQAVNAVLSVGAAGLMAALGEEIFGGRKTRRSALLLYVCFLPMLFFNSYVYGTVPMIFFCALGFLCFVRYLRTRRAALGLAAALSMGIAYAAKPNAMVPIMALAICAVIDVMRSRDVKLLGFAALAFAFALGLSRLVIWQYELRSGIELAENIHPLSWLVIGFADSEACPGWYNGYMEQFYEMGLTAQEQKAIVMADLAKRLPELLADPAYTLDYLRRKILSQWTEPTYSVLRYGERCEWVGRFNGVAALAYRSGEPLRALLEGVMNIGQQSVYILACLGLLGTLRRREDAGALVIPVTVIGGFLYHALFEAKSQYIYPYIFYLMPYAAHGLCMLSGWTAEWLESKQKKA